MMKQHVPSLQSRAYGWLWWTASVLVAASVLNHVPTVAWGRVPGRPVVAGPASTAGIRFDAAPLLQRPRRVSCATGSGVSDHDLGLRVGALFIILFVSFVGCAFPIVAARRPGLWLPTGFFFAVRHFGTGVLIATAFVHLLPTAFIQLGNPCLSSFWTKDYDAMPGAIVLASIFFITLVEMVFHPARASNPNPPMPQSPVRERRVLQGRTSSIGRGLSRMEAGHDNNQDNMDEVLEGDDVLSTEQNVLEAGKEEHVVVTLSPEQQHKKDVMQIFLLEGGILFHSVFIGMALTVALGNEFVILLIAIVFHRTRPPCAFTLPKSTNFWNFKLTRTAETFEGLALGSRIAAIKWPNKSLKPIFMALAYGCTTPLGQAIGLAARSSYSPDSELGLILVGVMNAISAGLLIFASLIELLSEDLLTDESWKVLHGKRRVGACVLIFAGAFAMSAVGAWA